MAMTKKVISDDKIIIELKNRMVILQVQPFDGDLDTESLLKIDYGNIVGEVLTFPVVFNRIANLKADLANILAETRVDMDIHEAQLYNKHKNALNAIGKATEKSIEAAVFQDPEYKIKRKAYYQRQRDFDYLDSLYWSAQSKDTKLNKLSEKIMPVEFEKELLEGVVNNVKIKVTRKAIQ